MSEQEAPTFGASLKQPFDQRGVRTALAALGRRLDELAMAGADEKILDGMIAAMRHRHDRIVADLATAAGIHPALAIGRRVHLPVA